MKDRDTYSRRDPRSPEWLGQYQHTRKVDLDLLLRKTRQAINSLRKYDFVTVKEVSLNESNAGDKFFDIYEWLESHISIKDVLVAATFCRLGVHRSYEMASFLNLLMSVEPSSIHFDSAGEIKGAGFREVLPPQQDVRGLIDYREASLLEPDALVAKNGGVAWRDDVQPLDILIINLSFEYPDIYVLAMYLCLVHEVLQQLEEFSNPLNILLLIGTEEEFDRWYEKQ